MTPADRAELEAFLASTPQRLIAIGSAIGEGDWSPADTIAKIAEFETDLTAIRSVARSRSLHCRRLRCGSRSD